MQVVVRQVRTRGRRADWPEIKAAVEQVMRDTIAPRFASYAERIVASWNHKIRFKTTFKVSKKRISVYVYPIGGNAKFWRWTSRGTEPHTITARKKPLLKYQAIWTPKTSPGGHYKGKGTKTGPWISKQTVDHPGTTPRHIEERWAEWAQPWFRPTIERTMRRAIRQSR